MPVIKITYIQHSKQNINKINRESIIHVDAQAELHSIIKVLDENF